MSDDNQDSTADSPVEEQPMFTEAQVQERINSAVQKRLARQARSQRKEETPQPTPESPKATRTDNSDSVSRAEFDEMRRRVDRTEIEKALMSEGVTDAFTLDMAVSFVGDAEGEDRQAKIKRIIDHHKPSETARDAQPSQPPETAMENVTKPDRTPGLSAPKRPDQTDLEKPSNMFEWDSAMLDKAERDGTFLDELEKFRRTLPGGGVNPFSPRKRR